MIKIYDDGINRGWRRSEQTSLFFLPHCYSIFDGCGYVVWPWPGCYTKYIYIFQTHPCFQFVADLPECHILFDAVHTILKFHSCHIDIGYHRTNITCNQSKISVKRRTRELRTERARARAGAAEMPVWRKHISYYVGYDGLLDVFRCCNILGGVTDRIGKLRRTGENCRGKWGKVERK